MSGVCAVMMVRDEVDVIEATIRHLLHHVDAVLVADNGSKDGTLDLLGALREEDPDRVMVTRDDEVAYYQSRKMTRMAEWARDLGMEWVLPCDADEIWHPNDLSGPTISDVLNDLPPRYQVAKALLYDHVASAEDPPARGPGAKTVGQTTYTTEVMRDPFEMICWRRREPSRLPKVAARLLPGLTIRQGNHSADYPGPSHAAETALSIRHFPYRSVEQMIRKARNGSQAYAATDLPYETGQHWRDYGRLLESGGEEAIAEVFRTWFWSAEPTANPTLIYDPAPVRR
jgi:hypothetical protein